MKRSLFYLTIGSAFVTQANAAIQAAPGGTPPDSASDPLAELRDTVNLVEIPWPEWVWWAIAAGVVLLLSLLGWLIVRVAKNRPKTAPPTPREIVRRQLSIFSRSLRCFAHVH
jgi:hypothetical protein